ncbi:Protein FD [Hordeum vulgare]|uniref:Predicted protein n=1 Tax=Hordeum vulgare subsp. vulgare TaxID=112509 RepID=F2EI59_HORVV|nr:Protein FD [Hordeum vulgare]BAK07031.1 predicted protein [Hordeum vulgare subsp. vulgare]
MEELWKDMSLPSTPAALQSYHIHSPAVAPYHAAAYLQDCLAGPVPLPRGAPYTALTLSSSVEFAFPGGGSSGKPTGSTSSNDYSFGFPSASASGPKSSNNNGKRVQVNAPAAVDRQLRMIKNRESAARSRARKQAYTNELEMELAQLRRENEMLVKREQDFINESSATAAQVVLPDCSSGGGGRSRSSRPTLHFELEQRQRCRSAPAP